MVPDQVCQYGSLFLGKPGQITTHDQLIAVLGMLEVSDVMPDVVQQARILQQLSITIGKTLEVHGVVKDLAGKTGNFLRVFLRSSG